MSNNHAFAIIQAYNWTQAVIYQGERVFENFNRDNSMFERMRAFDEFPSGVQNIDTLNQSHLLFEESRQNQFIRVMDEHYFVIALGKSIDYMKIFSEFDHIVQEIDSMFSLRKINDLRNMREHDDEYTSGNGRAQSRFEFIDIKRSCGGDMTGTICSSTEYYLGNVEIRSIVAFYRSKLTEIEGIYYNKLNSLYNNYGDDNLEK